MFKYRDLRLFSNHFFAVATAFLCVSTSFASSVTFQDVFQRDDQIALFSFTVGSPTSVDIRSVGYAGDQSLVPAGGFDTYLTLFDSSGFFLAENDDGEDSAIDPTTGQGFDAELIQHLLPGTYLFTLTQYGNYAVDQYLSDGFSQTGNPSYTNDPGFAPGDGCPSGLFKDSSGSDGRCRNGNYVIEFLNDDPGTTATLVDSGSMSPTPEPSCVALMLLGCAGIGWGKLRSRLGMSDDTKLVC